jgi:hypothetical protein
MLKFGFSNIPNSNSKTLIPRNLTYKYSLNSTSINNNSITNNTLQSQSSGNFDNASINNLNVGTISELSNVINPYIVFNGPVAFSVLRAEYLYNDFKNYPILFTRNILINNKNLTINSESILIKDNVIQINNQIKNNDFLNSTSDIFISGLIFPIIDQNSSTGYFSGLLYLPNNKIKKVSSTSNYYKWTNEKYQLFRNIDKGFYKLKYLTQDNDFSSYQNQMTSKYVDLFDNNNNLSNLIVNSLGITDGEIVAFNNDFLNIMIGDQNNIPINVLTFNKNNINLKNNIDLLFENSLNIKSTINYLNFTNNLITFFSDILFDSTSSNINFTNQLIINSNNQQYIIFDNTNQRIQFLKNVIINSLTILNDLQLNFENLYFNSNFNIGSLINNVFISYLNFTNTSSNQSLNLLIDSFVGNLTINQNLIFNNSLIKFTNILSFNSSINETYFNLSSTSNSVNFIKKVNITTLEINTQLSLTNNASLNVTNNFLCLDSFGNQLFNFDSIYSKIYYNLFINKTNPKITFEDFTTIEISSLNPNIKLEISQNNINIIGPHSSLSTNLNVIVGSSLNITNIGCSYESGLNKFTFVPMSKLYVLSGSTKPNENISFIFKSIYSIINENTTQFSGKINLTTRAMDGNYISVYNINIWTTPNGIIEYDTINPINTNLLGDWSISNIILNLIQPLDTGDYYNLTLNCNGSPNYNVIWGIKLDGLSI